MIFFPYKPPFYIFKKYPNGLIFLDLINISPEYGELSGGITVRYNKVTDYVQLLSDGEWVNWRKGNLGKYYLIADGVAQVPFAGNYTQTESSFTVIRDSSSNGCSTVDVIDASGYTKLVAVVSDIRSGYDLYPLLIMGNLTKTGKPVTGQQTIQLDGISSNKVTIQAYSTFGSFQVIDLWLE